MKKSEINILIVDDDKTMRESLTEAVKRKGYRPIAVAKPDEAESIVKIKPIHGLIVDVMLPGKNGVDLVKKLKENIGEEAVIIFTSGIYKDRTFAQEAIKKVGALEFFTKPFNLDEVLTLLDKKVSQLVEAPKVDLHSLLATPFASQRERRKALDHVEELLGYDLPFVFCILMDSESSGHLNIVDLEQNIFGVTFVKGCIAKFDGESTGLFTKKLLLQHGFITEHELSEIKTKAAGGDFIKTLVDQGLMSPHAMSIIKTETTVNELNKLVNGNKLQINFVLDRKLKEEDDNVDMPTLVQHLHNIIDRHLPLAWLKKFYASWAGHPISVGPQFVDLQQFSSFPLMTRVAAMTELLKKEQTLEDLIAQCPQVKEEDIYKALHFLMLRRVVVFQEAKRVKNIDDHIHRLKSMHAAVKDRNPIDIFKYFGLNDNPKANDVIRIYKEFAKTHHPDTLPPTVAPEVRAMNHELFAKVTAAYEVLSSEENKQKYFNELKQVDAEKQIKSDELISGALLPLSRGHYAEAFPLLEMAYKLYVSERSQLHYWWVKFKIEGKMTPEEAEKIEMELKMMSQGMKKTPLWIFVNALSKRYGGDLLAAKNDFQKVVDMDPNFTDARRELTGLRSVKAKNEDLLTGDISVVVKNLFKKKGA